MLAACRSSINTAVARSIPSCNWSIRCRFGDRSDVQRLQLPIHVSSLSFSTSSRDGDSDESLLRRLGQLEELDLDSATNELRWMRDKAYEGSSDEAARGTALLDMVERRSKGVPLQYILGDTDFGPLTLLCRPPVLIPRPETAHVFERLATLWNNSRASPRSDPLQMADLYTGSGAIALLMSHLISASPVDRMVGVDLSPEAIRLAADNLVYLRTQRPDRNNDQSSSIWTTFHPADICTPTFASHALTLNSGRKYGLITANPPYIPHAEWEDLPRSVKEHEDVGALSSTASWSSSRSVPASSRLDGTEHYHTIASLLPHLLLPESEMAKRGFPGMPRIGTEIGAGQARAVQEIFEAESGGWVKRTECWKDQFGMDRMVVGWTS